MSRSDSEITRRVYVPQLRREQLQALDDDLVHFFQRPARIDELDPLAPPHRDDEPTRPIHRR